MNKALEIKLRHLRNDYRQVNGKAFNHFFCPILFKDEDTQLCKAHIVNQGFFGSPRAWTIQRADVDNFYGANFEEDFIDIQYNEGGLPKDILVDKTLYKRFNPKLSVDDKQVDFFVAKGKIPEQFTPIKFETENKNILLGLKMTPSDFLAASDGVWEIKVSKDMRLSAMVSLIKAAHLTLFAMHGYRYALSDSGYFVGKGILGNFFNQNNQRSKAHIFENAKEFFREYQPMVRPVETDVNGLRGTISDHTLYLCGENNFYWAWIVLIRTSKTLNAVLIPILESENAKRKFQEFLLNKDEKIEASRCVYLKDHWEVEKHSEALHWPKAGVLYP